MLQIKDINISMKKDLRELVSDFSFTLNSGDKAAIIGEEGNGKSTLLKLIYDESLVDSYAEYSGTVMKDGLILGYLSQEMTEEEKDMTVYEFCSQESSFLESEYGEIAQTAARLKISADMVYSERKMRTLSGGEKVKLRMLVIMLKNPDVLLLDEPSNDIDIETLEWLEVFINESLAPVIFISHDETLIENTANVIIHIEQLRRKTLPRHVIVRMRYEEYVRDRLDKFEHQDQVAKKEREEQKKQQERYRQLYQKVDHELGTNTRQDPHRGKMLKRKMKAVKSMGKRFDKESENLTEFSDSEEAIMISFNESVKIPAGKTIAEFKLDKLKIGDNTLSENIELNVKGAEHICIVGKNGAGKTTLLKKIADDLLPRIDIKCAYMPQDYAETVDFEVTPVEYLAKTSEKSELTKARTYLGSMKYTAEEMEHSIGELSGGQKAKLFFLKMILDENNVLVLDEPTRNFSPLSNPVIRQILKEFGGAIISVSHDRKYIDEVCESVYLLESNGLSKVDKSEILDNKE